MKTPLGWADTHPFYNLDTENWKKTHVKDF